MELGELLKQIKKQEIKKGNPVEVTVHPDREGYSDKEYYSKIKYKAIGYFNNIYTKGHRVESGGPVLEIEQYKGHKNIPAMSYDSDSFLVSNVVKIRRLG